MAMTTDARGWVFQSLIGRLKTYSDALAPSSLDKFQSLIGRLKTDLTSLYQMWYNMFQSLIGRLKTFGTGRYPRGRAGLVSIPHR